MQLDLQGGFPSWQTNVLMWLLLNKMAICIRFIDHIHGEFEVREEFIGFVEMEKVDAESISSAIVNYVSSRM